MSTSLSYRWSKLSQSFCDDTALCDTLFDDIEQRYSEPQRAYHTLAHLQALFTAIDRYAIDSVAIEFAVWYHDIIYQPGSADNESKSAIIAESALSTMAVDDKLSEKVSYMIHCTQTHSNPQGCHDTELFLDADMAILGSQPRDYQVYLTQIQREFKHLAKQDFRSGRENFIRSVLQQERIFASPIFFKHCEQQARINLQWELGQLAALE